MTPDHLRRIARANGIRRVPKLTRQQHPDRIVLDYFKRIREGVVRTMRDLVDHHLTASLVSLAAEAQSSKIARADAATERLEQIMADIAKRFAAVWTPSRFANLVRDPAEAVARFNASQLNGQLFKIFGIDVVGNEPWLRDALREFVGENVSLIKTIPATAFPDIEKRVARALADGERASSMVEHIEHAYQVSEGRAKVIARDQISKLNGDLNQIRQRDLGIDTYVWQTVNDNRVRPEHEARQGKTYRWDDPPGDLSDPGDGGHPGEAIQCRCYAEPNLEAILRGDA